MNITNKVIPNTDSWGKPIIIFVLFCFLDNMETFLNYSLSILKTLDLKKNALWQTLKNDVLTLQNTFLIPLPSSSAFTNIFRS